MGGGLIYLMFVEAIGGIWLTISWSGRLEGRWKKVVEATGVTITLIGLIALGCVWEVHSSPEAIKAQIFADAQVDPSSQASEFAYDSFNNCMGSGSVFSSTDPSVCVSRTLAVVEQGPFEPADKDAAKRLIYARAKF